MKKELKELTSKDFQQKSPLFDDTKKLASQLINYVSDLSATLEDLKI